MSEIKRAHLIPLGSQKETDKSSKAPRKTIRITVVLPESNEHTCPEYNYKDELAAAKKSEKYKDTGPIANGSISTVDFDDDDDVRRIAQQMEQKYGSTDVSLNKKKRKNRKDDYADIGMGYDESDSFIDNTDGYDEMIPQNVTTLHGGFYINSGALEFKTDDEANSDFSSSSDDEEVEKTRKKKRVIESSDETDRENKTEINNVNHVEKKRKMQNGGNGLQPSIKKKLLQGPNKIYIKKRRLMDPLKKTVKELIREKREDLNMSIPSDLKTEESIVENSDAEKKDMSITSVTDAIESVIKASAEKTEPKKIEEVKKSNSSPLPLPPSEGSSSQEIIKNDIKLPENLPNDIVDIITTIKNLFLKNNGESKSMFTSEVNQFILRLERKSKCLGKPSKMKVYEHLAKFSNCKTDSLIRRAKNLILEDEQKKLKTLLADLRKEINKIMPGLLENYEKESQRVLQKKFSQESVENDENKSLRMPKRRFAWNDLTKKLLKDILMLKKRCLLLEGKNKEALDAQMMSCLKSDIQILWPDGWMSMNALNKIYTTYADPKRLLNNNSTNPALPVQSNSTVNSQLQPQSKTSSTVQSSTLTTSNKSNTTAPANSANSSSNGSKSSAATASIKNLPQSFNSNNLSITPIAAPVVKNDIKTTSGEDIKIDATINLSMKSLPEKSPCDIMPPSPKKEIPESKLLKVKSPSEFLIKPANSVKKLSESAINLVNDDNVIIIDSVTPSKNDRVSPVKEKQPHKTDSNYQVIDLSDKFESKKSIDLTTTKQNKSIDFPTTTATKNKSIDLTTTTTTKNKSIDLTTTTTTKNKSIDLTTTKNKYVDLGKDTTISPLNSEQPSRSSHSNKHHELSITPSYPPINTSTPTSKIDLKKSISGSGGSSNSNNNNNNNNANNTSSGGDDIQKVMENLKALQKMSSPKKCVSDSASSSPASSSSAAVSVIAVNKTFAPKSVHSQQNNSSTMQRIDYPKSDYGSSFQEEFHKQLFSALNHISTTTPSKSSYNSLDRFPHIAGSSGMMTNDKYYQNANNNYGQSSNGHKNTTPTPQSGTYSILDDMFANFLTQYGYPKEATVPKSQQK